VGCIEKKLPTSTLNLGHKLKTFSQPKNPIPKMKKLIYILALVTVIAGSITSCTDENVRPTTNETGAGGTGHDPR
jgi:hypothetical protein